MTAGEELSTEPCTATCRITTDDDDDEAAAGLSVGENTAPVAAAAVVTDGRRMVRFPLEKIDFILSVKKTIEPDTSEILDMEPNPLMPPGMQEKFNQSLVDAARRRKEFYYEHEEYQDWVRVEFSSKGYVEEVVEEDDDEDDDEEACSESSDDDEDDDSGDDSNEEDSGSADDSDEDSSCNDDDDGDEDSTLHN